MYNRAPAGHARGRDGGIPLVVRSVLTLFEVVGLTFQFYGQTARPLLREFRPEAADLVEQTRVLASIVGHDLRDARDDADFADSLAAIDEWDDRASTLKENIRTAAAAETNPARHRMLLELCDDLEEMQSKSDVLRRLIEELQRGDSD